MALPIKRAMRNNGSNEPIFETDDARSYFVTILNKRKKIKLSADKPLDTVGYRQIIEDGNLQEKQVLDYLTKNGIITSKIVQKLLNIKESGTRDLLKQMTDKALLVKQGQARNTHYILGDMADDK